ncbi:MAG: acyl-CoA thioesterase [Alphaproteobacteria bacterium]|nr:acyl-CoA thioesterase [Alphaproteobacteria bacterium]
MSADAHAFVLPITIQPDDIDELGHVNNGVYLRWAQDAATAHWRARGDPDMIARYVWVVARHEIDYRQQLVLGDAIEARTWTAPGPRGALWTRFVSIWKAGAAKPAAEIKSDWCLMDAQTRRIRRVPGEIVARFVARPAEDRQSTD